MLVENLFQDTFDLPVLGHAVVLIVFCGGGLGFVGWTKQRLSDPLVNVACSLTALSTITILTKEGSVQSGDLSLGKIFQVLKIVIMGVVIAMAVSFLIFPTSARRNLRKSLVKAADTLAVMLSLITASFLEGSEEILSSEKFLKAEKEHRQAYNTLDSLIRDAKLEHFFAGTEKEYRLEKRLVRWVQDITHSIGGLRSAAALQFSLIREPLAHESDSPSGLVTPAGESMALEHSCSFHDSPFLEPIEEQSEEDLTDATSTQESTFSSAGIFSIFIHHLGRPMVSSPKTH